VSTVRRGEEAPRRNHVGTISLLVAVAGAVGARVALAAGPYAGAPWLHVVAAGFEAGLVGALADWFAVTALFRHPLGLPIPHTAIIPARRAKIIESIVGMVQDEWLSPEVIGTRLRRLSPSALLVDWLDDPEHLRRLGAPVRDLLRALARMLSESEVAAFVERTVRRQLGDVRIDAATGQWMLRLIDNGAADAGFQTAARSLAKLARQASTAEALYSWLDRAAAALRKDGRRLVPLLLRRKVVQRALVDAACDYASSELAAAAEQMDHPLRRGVFAALHRFAARMAEGDAATIEQVEHVRRALVDSFDGAPMISELLRSMRGQLEDDLQAGAGSLAPLIDRQLRSGIRGLLGEQARRDSFDSWVRATAEDLLRRHHDQIGLTVRENLEALETDELVAQIERRVGADLQFIRLNGAVVGGLIGVGLALLRRALG
jgi:uncharacterized membrane-anchored protein YjiN (DUF445 family)